MARTKSRKRKQKIKDPKKEKAVVKSSKRRSRSKKSKKLQKVASPPINSVSGSDRELECVSDPANLKTLLEPYSKAQIMDFIVNAALKDDALLNRIRSVADRDVSHRKIFVHGLRWETTRDTLISAFQSFGEVEDCSLITNHITGKSKGYAFVLFKSRQGAIKALKEPSKMIDNRMTSSQLASVGSAGAHPAQDTSGRKIYVASVPTDADSVKLRDFFAKFGDIEIGPIGFDMSTGKSRGFALFVYKTVEGARKALEQPHKIFEGHHLHCQLALDSKNKVAQQPTLTSPMVPVASLPNLMFDHQGAYNTVYGNWMANPSARPTGFIAPGNAISKPGSLSAAVGHQMNVSPLGASDMGRLSVSQPTSHDLRSTHTVAGSYGSDAPSYGLHHGYSSSQFWQLGMTRPEGRSFGTSSTYFCYK